jgi:hypothetical protein
MKITRLLLASAFVIAIGSAFITKPAHNAKRLTAAFINPASCTQSSCFVDGGGAQCTDQQYYLSGCATTTNAFLP